MTEVIAQGERVPALGFGTWQLTGKRCRDAVAHALAVGYRHVDTAQLYGNEDEVGAALAAAAVPRQEVFLVTKVDPAEAARDRVRPSVEASLRRLGTDAVDLLLLHWPTPDLPVEEPLEAMEALRREGKTRHVGVSNFTPSLVRRACDAFPILANQVEYHPYLSQDALRALAVERDHVLTAYSPLARGRVLREPAVVEAAEAHGATPAQVVLAWLLAQDHVAVIPKATSPARIEENLAALGVELAPEERRRIAALDRGDAGRLVDSPFVTDWER